MDRSRLEAQELDLRLAQRVLPNLRHDVAPSTLAAPPDGADCAPRYATRKVDVAMDATRQSGTRWPVFAASFTASVKSM